MHTDTGELTEMTEAEIQSWSRAVEDDTIRRYSEKRKMVELSKDEAGMLKPMTPEKRKGWMRNKPCPCGSGTKFKRCCWSKFT